MMIFDLEAMSVKLEECSSPGCCNLDETEMEMDFSKTHPSQLEFIKFGKDDEEVLSSASRHVAWWNDTLGHIRITGAGWSWTGGFFQLFYGFGWRAVINWNKMDTIFV